MNKINDDGTSQFELQVQKQTSGTDSPRSISLNDTFEELASGKSSPMKLERAIHAVSKIIDMAFYGGSLPGLRVMMPPGSIYGEVNRECAKAYWLEVLGRPLEDVVSDYKQTVNCPADVNIKYICENLRDHTLLYLSAAKVDVETLKRAVFLLPHYTHFLGATFDPIEAASINPQHEMERLNKIFAGGTPPKPGTLELILVDTEQYGTLEVTRHMSSGSRNLHYTIGRDGVAWGMSGKNGLTDLQGIFPDLVVADPRSLKYPTYSELRNSVEAEGRNIRYDQMGHQKTSLAEYSPSGPHGFIYCDYQAQQSLIGNLPGRHRARINAVSESWSSQLRLKIYGEAARSPDVNIRCLGTRLASLYRVSVPLLREALQDRSPKVVAIAQNALRGFEDSGEH